jgi:hypothetical protein
MKQQNAQLSSLIPIFQGADDRMPHDPRPPPPLVRQPYKRPYQAPPPDTMRPVYQRPPIPPTPNFDTIDEEYMAPKL